MNQHKHPSCARLALIGLLAHFLTIHPSSAQSTWNSTNGGAWTNSANWSGGVPNASSAVVVLETNWNAKTITNVSATVGQILAGRTITNNASGNFALTVTGGTLTLDNGADRPVISTGTNNSFGEFSRFRITSVLAGTNGFERQGSGYLDLQGVTNTFTGTIVLNATNAGGTSFTVIDRDANLGDSNNTIHVATTAETAAGFYTAQNAGVITLNENRSIVTSGSGDFWMRIRNTNSNNVVTIAGEISGSARLRKTDIGTLVLTAGNTFSGGTLLSGGTLRLSGGDNRLSATGVVTFAGSSIFDITSTFQTLDNLVTDATVTNTVRGSNGTLTIGGDVNFAVSRNSASAGAGTSLDMSNLSTFILNPAGGAAGRTNQFTAGGLNVTNDIYLARGTNTFLNNSILWGGGASNVAGQQTVVHLGQLNTIQAGSNFHIAHLLGSGEVRFQAGLSAPSLTVRGAAGGADPIPVMSVGHVNSVNQSGAGLLDATGGSVDIIATALHIAEHNAGSSATAATGTMTMGAGTVVAETLSVARKSATSGSPAVTGTMNQSGGSVTATTLHLGSTATSSGNTPDLIANYNLTGGTLHATTIGASGSNFGAGSVRNLNIDGGKVQNLAGADLTLNGLSTNAAGRINVVLGTSGAMFEADAGRSVTFGTNSLVSGAGTLTKTGAGTLTLVAGNTFTGGVVLEAGTLRINNGSALGANPAAATNQLTFAGHSTLQFFGSPGLFSTRGLQINAGVTATIDTGANNPSINGIVAGPGALHKAGAGSLALLGANTYTGPTVVNAGTLNLNATTGGAAASTASVSVASGATLLLSRSAQVSDSATVTLSGGTIRRGAGVSEVFGNLVLGTASFLDFGTGTTGTLSFGTYTPSALLTVQNFLPGNKLQFTSALTAEQLDNGELFSFSNGFNTGMEGGYFTITAIPEPSAFLVTAGLLGFLLCSSWRKRPETEKSSPIPPVAMRSTCATG